MNLLLNLDQQKIQLNYLSKFFFLIFYLKNFRGIFELVELMKMDMANFALSQNRQLITSQSAKIEFEEFMRIYEMDKCK